MTMKKKKRTLADKYKVLEIQKKRAEDRVKKIAPLIKKIYNITSQFK